MAGYADDGIMIPNFLATGILAIAVGLVLIVWSIRHIDRPHGSRVFAGLGALLFLVGGGVAQVGFVVLCWAVSTRIGRPPAWVRNAGAGTRATLARLWWAALVVGVVLVRRRTLEVGRSPGFVPFWRSRRHPNKVVLVVTPSMPSSPDLPTRREAPRSEPP